MRQKLIDKMIGKKYGMLEIISFLGIDKRHNAQWLCICSCENKTECIRTTTQLNTNSNFYLSCGCNEETRKHEEYKKKYKYNKYDLSGNYGIGYTSKGEKFYFDLEDYEKIKNYCWNKTKSGHITSGTRKTETGEESVQIFLHRLVLGLPSSYKGNDFIGEHKNRHPEDNRKENLHVSTQPDNMTNKKVYKNNKSGVRGILKKKNRWLVRLWFNKECVVYKMCDTFEEALQIRREAESKYFGKILS